jgi:signal transduction histidine kinase
LGQPTIVTNKDELVAGSVDQSAVLLGLCHAFGSASHLDEAIATVPRWVRAAVAWEAAPVRLLLPAPGGHLRVALAQGDWDTGGRRLSARRRLAYLNKTILRLQLKTAEDEVLAIIPLVSCGESLGLLEVVAPRRSMDKRWGLLDAVASQTAIVLRNLRARERLERQVEAMGRVATLTRDIVRAGTPEAAVRAAARYCFDRFHLPVVAWLSRDRGTSLSVVATHGLTGARRAELRTSMAHLPRWSGVPARNKSDLAARFGDLMGTKEVAVIDAGYAVLFLAGGSASMQPPLDTIGSLLEDVLEHLATVSLAERRNERLDLGIAWTAHEVRGPLLGARAVMESLAEATTRDPDVDELLDRSQKELAQLAELVEGVLRWAVGSGALRRRPVNLVRVVEEAVQSCCFELKEDRVLLSAPSDVMVRADPRHLRGAIANVIRNALAYSPPATPVRVSVESGDRFATVRVKDDGPGIPRAEREAIFDPLVQGQAGRFSRCGKGLGLFISRQVALAHNGAIWVDSNGKGAVFNIEIPREDFEPDLAPTESTFASPAGTLRRER